MASEKTNIWNRALRAMGATDEIEDADLDTGPTALTLRQEYDDVTGDLFENGDWWFLNRYFQLNPSTDLTALEMGSFAYQYVYPSDMNKLTRIVTPGHERVWADRNRIDYDIVYNGNSAYRILANESPLTLQYQAVAPPESMWPASFRSAVAFALAAATVNAVRGDSAPRDLEAKAERAIGRARNAAGNQVPGPPEAIPDLEDARR